MAHAQEHMMFRGSPGLSGDQLAAVAAGMGGTFNADTQQSVTQYFFTVPAEDVDLALHIEPLRMRGVLDSEHLWDHERGAIEQEVAQDLSDPEYVLYHGPGDVRAPAGSRGTALTRSQRHAAHPTAAGERSADSIAAAQDPAAVPPA